MMSGFEILMMSGFKVWMMSGDNKQISCQTMADRIGEDAETVQINQKKIPKQFDFA